MSSLVKKHPKLNEPVILQAYAKMYGSYFSLKGGFTIEAAVDFTGGIPEVISITKDTEPEILFYNLEKAFQVESLMQKMFWSRHFLNNHFCFIIPEYCSYK